MKIIKKIAIIIIYLLLVGDRHACPLQPCFADFRFAVIGDTRDDSKDGINVKIMNTILDKIKSEGVDFILVTGDMITGSAKSAAHINRLKKWKGIIEKYKIPFYISMGNHDVESEMSENIARSVFEMPQNGPRSLEELSYSFDHKNAHFVAIDTAIFNSFHSIGQAQLNWLKEDLEKNNKSIIFIFGHDPVYTVYNHKGSSLDKYAAQRDELWGIFKQRKVSVYFCGHEHLYNRSIHDGIYQIITGGGGAHISASEKHGGFNNFVIIDVKDNNEIDVTVKDISGSVRDTLKIR